MSLWGRGTHLILGSRVDLGGPGAVRGDRPRRPPSTLETESILEPGRAEVGGTEPENSSHRPGRGRPRGWGRGREHREVARGGQRQESRREGRPGAGAGSHTPASLSLSTRPSSPSTRTRSADRRSWVEVSGGNRSQAVAEVPRVPPHPTPTCQALERAVQDQGLQPPPTPLGRRTALPSLCQRPARPRAAHTLSLLCLKALGSGRPLASAHAQLCPPLPGPRGTRAARTARPLLAGPGVPMG